MDVISNLLALVDPCTDVIALQEVGGTAHLEAIAPEFSSDDFQLQEYIFSDSELQDFFVYGTEQLDSYLGQVILLSRDAVDFIHSTYAGSRVIGVHYRDCSGHDRRVFSVHLPHQDASEDAFHQAVHELQVLCQGHRREEVVLIGDFNVEPSTDRAALLDDALSHCKFQQFRPEGATRFGHRSASALDFAYISEPISRRLLSNESHIKVVQGSRREVGSDHDKICLELVFGQRLPHSSKRHKDRRRRARGKCGRWTVKPNVGASVQSCEGFRDLDVHGQWEQLKQLQRACSFPTPSCKYRDSIALKDMCRQRREEVDPCAKQTLTRAIVAKRSAEKAEWLRSLESRAASGDARAIHYLKGRLQPRHAWGDLIRNCGARSAAVEAVRTHFRDILSPVVPAAEQAECAHLLHKLTAATESLTPTPFTYDEISKAVQHLKPGKTSGMTGISAELVKALWQDEDGQSIISCFCNSLLSTDDLPQTWMVGSSPCFPKLPMCRLLARSGPFI